jgi:hypothetical protein
MCWFLEVEKRKPNRRLLGSKENTSEFAKQLDLLCGEFNILKVLFLRKGHG